MPHKFIITVLARDMSPMFWCSFKVAGASTHSCLGETLGSWPLVTALNFVEVAIVNFFFDAAAGLQELLSLNCPTMMN